MNHHNNVGSQNSTVCILTGQGLGSLGHKYCWTRDFSLHQNHPDQFWGPPSLLLSGYQGSFVEVRQPGLEADRSPPSRAKVMNDKTAIIYSQHN